MQCKRLAEPNQLFPDEPSSLWSAPFVGACAEIRLNMVDIEATKRKSPRNSRCLSWKDADVKFLLELIQEETILLSMDNAKTPKEKRAAYRNVQVKLQNKGSRSLNKNLLYMKIKRRCSR